MERDKIVGLILAAGYSSRMGAFKPLLPIGDMTAIERVSATLKEAGVYRIIGVTGFQRERLSSILTLEGILEAYNPDFGQGMFTSIKAGIRKALERYPPIAGLSAGSVDGPPEASAAGPSASPVAAGPSPDIPPEIPGGFLLMPVDCPLIPAGVLEMILEKHREDPEAFIVPCFRGKKGHPLFIPLRYADEILTYEGEGGLKAVTARHEDRLIRLETGAEAVVLDMDTRSGYKEVLDYYENRNVDADYNEELKGKRLFLIRHGEIRQHREKIFLGQTDVPLSEKGREQAAAAAEELRRHGISASRIYTSDLSRAAETAEIIRHRLKEPPEGRRADGTQRGESPEITVIREPRFREMSLGDWDGCYISEIREKYPQEYQKRGENLLTYKYGNDSENFFDLQYRAMKGFLSLLRREREAGDGGRDIVIVTHSGVINVIVSNLRHTELAEEIKTRIPNGGLIIIDDPPLKKRGADAVVQKQDREQDRKIYTDKIMADTAGKGEGI